MGGYSYTYIVAQIKFAEGPIVRLTTLYNELQLASLLLES